jgi:CheY-like chemotaxis protein
MAHVGTQLGRVVERARGRELGAAMSLVKPCTRQHVQAMLRQIAVSQHGDATSAHKADARNAEQVILLAEDNEANILTVGDYLAAIGYKVVVARNGAEAVACTQELQPDLILMDIQMPGMDGLEAPRRIRADARQATTPIVALTALAMPGDRERRIAAGATDYVSKPVSLRGLLATIETYLG